MAPNRLIVLFRFINLLKKSKSECMQIACNFLILKLVPFDILNVITIQWLSFNNNLMHVIQNIINYLNQIDFRTVTKKGEIKHK